MILVVCLMSVSTTASADKHFDRIMAKAIDEAQAEGPTTDAKVLQIWRAEMVKFGDGACRCANIIGFTTIDGELVQKKALCNQSLVEDLQIALLPELLRLPGNYELWQNALKQTAAGAGAVGEEISTRFLSANVKAKEQAEVRRRSGRCITGGEDH
jgi:hypothetical protein